MESRVADTSFRMNDTDRLQNVGEYISDDEISKILIN